MKQNNIYHHKNFIFLLHGIATDQDDTGVFCNNQVIIHSGTKKIRRTSQNGSCFVVDEHGGGPGQGQLCSGKNPFHQKLDVFDGQPFFCFLFYPQHRN